MAEAQLEAQREMREDLVKTLGRELLGPFDGPGRGAASEADQPVPPRATRTSGYASKPRGRRGNG